ncbi:MAG: Xaa-Pro peptidase family protein [Pseudomonadota bacterium]
MNAPEPFSARLKALGREMADAAFPALLIGKPENRRYLSGFTALDSQLDETSGYLLITADRQLLLTDSRYEIQAEREAKGFGVRIYQSGAPRLISEILKESRISRLGFEEDHLTVKTHRLLKAEFPGLFLEAAPGLMEKLRILKDQQEIKLLTRALGITEKAFAHTLSFLEPGRTEKETAHFLDEAMVKLGAEGPAFETIIASGPNAALPHAVPSKRKIRAGEPIVMDFGAKYDGYGADMTRTMVLGTPPPWLRKIYGVVRQAQVAALGFLGPGKSVIEADATARNIIAQAGYGENFGHSLGHGVGLSTHEPPSLSRFREGTLQPGMVVTVEPGIYLKGRGGVRLEEMVLITPEGARVLNRDKHFYSWPV